MDKNCYRDSSSREIKPADLPMNVWQEKLGRDKSSLVADPLSENPQEYDFRLKPDSPAIKLGFKPFDYSRAGVYGNDCWIRLAKSVPMPDADSTGSLS